MLLESMSAMVSSIECVKAEAEGMVKRIWDKPMLDDNSLACLEAWYAVYTAASELVLASEESFLTAPNLKHFRTLCDRVANLRLDADDYRGSERALRNELRGKEAKVKVELSQHMSQGLAQLPSLSLVRTAAHLTLVNNYLEAVDGNDAATALEKLEYFEYEEEDSTYQHSTKEDYLASICELIVRLVAAGGLHDTLAEALVAARRPLLGQYEVLRKLRIELSGRMTDITSQESFRLWHVLVAMQKVKVFEKAMRSAIHEGQLPKDKQNFFDLAEQAFSAVDIALERGNSYPEFLADVAEFIESFASTTLSKLAVDSSERLMDLHVRLRQVEVAKRIAELVRYESHWPYVSRPHGLSIPRFFEWERVLQMEVETDAEATMHNAHRQDDCTHW